MMDHFPRSDDKLTLRGLERVTIKDVARVAGCSVSTASLVLAGQAKERRLSDQLVGRVRAAARELDYAPNLLVRSLRQGRTLVIALYNGFGPREDRDFYMDHLNSLMARAAGASGYDLLTYCDYSRPVDATYRLLNGGRSDGLVYFGPLDNPLIPLLRRSSARLPVVLLNRVDEEGVLSSVSDDMRDGMEQVAAAMVAAGHRRVAAVGSSPGTANKASVRIAALREALEARGVLLPEERVLPIYGGGPFTHATALRHLLALPEPPTALFCWNDETGYQMLEECRAQGVAVPDALSLIGYDGLHWPSTSPHVLASVDTRLKGQAAAAVRLLDAVIAGKTPSPVREITPVTLTTGTTFGPPKDS